MTKESLQSDSWAVLPQLRWSIKTKLLVAFISTVIIFGLVNIVVVRELVGDEVENRLRLQSAQLAVHLSGELEEAILYEDWITVQRQLWEWKSMNSAHGYGLILGQDGVVLASTFDGGIPAGLLQVNQVPYSRAVSSTLYDKETRYLDVGVPIMSGTAGYLRLGIQESFANVTSDPIVRILSAMVAVFIVLGAAGSYLLGSMISRPLQAIASASRQVDIYKPQPPLSIRTGDEIEVLANNLETMIYRLQDHHHRLTEANQRAHEAENLASIGMISSGVAHEISNPIMGIETGLRRLERNPANAEQVRSYLPHMFQSVDHIKGVVQGLLSMARKDRGSTTDVEVAKLVQDSIDLMRYRIEEKGVKVSLQSISDSRLYARINHQDIMQVILNILINAIDASKANSKIEIVVGTSGESVRIAVTDSGPGIDEKLLTRIWQPFFTTRQSEHGTGLGLAISKRLVESNGGRIVARSTVGIGTTMEIKLPMTEVPRG